MKILRISRISMRLLRIIGIISGCRFIAILLYGTTKGYPVLSYSTPLYWSR
jgi:hypothetical protein